MPCFIIRDNDNKFGTEFDRVAKGAGMKVLRTAIRAPLMNSVCERFLGGVRRECLDHIIILGRRHLRRVLELVCAISILAALIRGLVSESPFHARARSIAKAPRSIRCPYLGDAITIVKWPHDDADRQRSQHTS